MTLSKYDTLGALGERFISCSVPSHLTSGTLNTTMSN